MTSDPRVLSLKPCPFCGAGSGYVKMGESPVPGSLMQSFQFVMCWDCRAVGPTRMSTAEAATAWNKRAEEVPITRTAAKETTCGSCFYAEHDVSGASIICHRFPSSTESWRNATSWCGEWKEGKR